MRQEQVASLSEEVEKEAALIAAITSRGGDISDEAVEAVAEESSLSAEQIERAREAASCANKFGLIASLSVDSAACLCERHTENS